ncbi:MAG TPA: hypothetical protein PLV75_12470 [Saprospiraceae bacterium]|nr:hypothetical protein [Saprospiraceae bacterium]
MSFLFWLLWLTNMLLLIIALLGKGFRSDFGAGVDLNVLLNIVLIVVLTASLILRYSVKQKWISLVVVALPICLMLIWYVIEKISGKSIG